MGTRGAALASVLMVTALALVLALSIASSGIFTLHFSLLEQNADRAGDVAESVVNEAISDLMNDSTYGSHGERIHHTFPDGTTSDLSFVDGTAGMLTSVNNLTGQSGVVGGSGRTVPPFCVDLIATGTCGDRTRTVECILERTLTAVAIGSSGPIASNGGLSVVRPAPAPQVTPLPANVASNSALQPAITLGQNTTVSGNVQAVGGIQLASGVNVMGQVQPNSKSVGLPIIAVSSLDPGTTASTMPASIDGGTVAGTLRRAGDLTVTNDLTLQNAFIFVTGNATFQGKVAGTGAILVEGTLSLLGGAQLQTDDLMAVMSQGDLQIVGQGQTISSFQGFMATGGNFKASQITMTGVFTANSNAAGGSLVNVSNMQVILNPAMVRVPIPTVGATSPSAPSPFTPGNGSYNAVCSNGLTFVGTTSITQNGPSQIVNGFPVAPGAYTIQGTIKDGTGAVVWSGTYNSVSPTSLSAAVAVALGDVLTRTLTPTIGVTGTPISWFGYSFPKLTVTLPNGTTNPPPSSGPPSQSGTTVLDLNQFILPEDDFIVLLWHTL